MSKNIILRELSHFFKNKVLFDNFNAEVYPNSKIAIIGKNGSGKSTLLKIIAGILTPSYGEYNCREFNIAYVPQLISDYENLSGSQRFNKMLSVELSKLCNVLCLDEPTNHLDINNKKSLIKMLNNFYGTLFIVTHDVDLIDSCCDKIWSLENGAINIFNGSYKDYLKSKKDKLDSLNNQIEKIRISKRENHNKLMLEQERYKKSKAYGQKRYDGDKLTLSSKKRKGKTTTVENRGKLKREKNDLYEQANAIYIPPEINPNFFFNSANVSKDKLILQIKNASCSYLNSDFVVEDIDLKLCAGEKLLISGRNGSGKTTLVKTVLGDDNILKAGDWILPRLSDIAYLDQHYKNLNLNNTVIEELLTIRGDWSRSQAHRHLNDFLFVTLDDINCKVEFLSGGEKARLSLALISAQTPKLLILDEVTNNIDIETKEHIISVLKKYTGAMLVISHDKYFIDSIEIDSTYSLD